MVVLRTHAATRQRGRRLEVWQSHVPPSTDYTTLTKFREAVIRYATQIRTGITSTASTPTSLKKSQRSNGPASACSSSSNRMERTTYTSNGHPHPTPSHQAIQDAKLAHEACGDAAPPHKQKCSRERPPPPKRPQPRAAPVPPPSPALRRGRPDGLSRYA